MNNYNSFLLGKGFLILTGIVAIVYLLACISILLGQNRLVFVPSKTIKTTPEDLGLSYQEVWIPVSPDQPERLHGWWIPATSPKTGVLLYLHGNGENIGANVERAMEFHQLGLDILLIDYRGYGQSEGKFPTETQVYQDAQAAWDYLVQKQGISAPEYCRIWSISRGRDRDRFSGEKSQHSGFDFGKYIYLNAGYGRSSENLCFISG